MLTCHYLFFQQYQSCFLQQRCRLDLLRQMAYLHRNVLAVVDKKRRQLRINRPSGRPQMSAITFGGSACIGQRSAATTSRLFPLLISPALTPLTRRRALPLHRCCGGAVVGPRGPTKREPKTAVWRERTKEDLESFVVVNFYKFVFIQDPQSEVAKHLAFLQGKDIHGRIYINEQGINSQYSGPNEDALAYAEWLKEDQRFSDVLVQSSPALDGHAFPRLKLRYKPSLVQMEGGISHLPLLDPAMRASPLAPSEWKKRLQAINTVGAPSEKVNSSVQNRNTLLLDVRNGYEWDIGHFQGAQRPNVDCFRSTYFGLSEQEVASSDPLAGTDKEQTDILMYCTGGIRCDVYSAILRERGFQNLYTLSGGVSNYLKTEGTSGWVGNLFVFDSRLAAEPSTYKTRAKVNGKPHIDTENTLIATCHICGRVPFEFRHRNCANLDCNRLYLSCNSCTEELRGCCCLNCTIAPRVRPALPGHRRYEKWHLYRDNEIQVERQ